MIHRWVGALWVNCKFLTIFMCGGAFFLLRERIVYPPARLDVAAAALTGLMFVSHDAAQLALATFGGYLLFWFALHVRIPRLARIGSRIDVSYGTYLYAWPVQMLLIHYVPGISPWLLSLLAVPIAMALGWLSWMLFEAPRRALSQAR